MSRESLTPANTRPKSFKTSSGVDHALPLFLPVCQLNSPFVSVDAWKQHHDVSGCIVNAYFLYKDRELRAKFNDGLSIRQFIGLDGLYVTDSGAFQGFARKLILSNKKIVRFQDQIGTDISSPLDLVTPPGDRRSVAEDKLSATLRRIREAMPLAEKSTLAGVQQGGRFLDLRLRSVNELMQIGVQYVAIGSLVPFFNRNHDVSFVASVLRDARRVCGSDIPIHIYGAGDPVELPFFVALGADIFDSSSYGHYASQGWYMTPYGALSNSDRLVSGEFQCECYVCRATSHPDELFSNSAGLAAHNLWTIVETIRAVCTAIAEDKLDVMLSETLRRHSEWFPESMLRPTWEAAHE